MLDWFFALSVFCLFLSLGNHFERAKEKIYYQRIINLSIQVLNVSNITIIASLVQIILKICKIYSTLKEFLIIISWVVKRLSNYVSVTGWEINYWIIKLISRGRIHRNKRSFGSNSFVVISMRSNKNIRKLHRYDFYYHILKTKSWWINSELFIVFNRLGKYETDINMNFLIIIMFDR